MDTLHLGSTFIQERFDESQLEHAALILKIEVGILVDCLNAGSKLLLDTVPRTVRQDPSLSHQRDISSRPIDTSANGRTLDHLSDDTDATYWQAQQVSDEQSTVNRGVPAIVVTPPRNNFQSAHNELPADGYSYVNTRMVHLDEPLLAVLSPHEMSVFPPSVIDQPLSRDSPTSLEPNTPILQDGSTQWPTRNDMTLQSSPSADNLQYQESVTYPSPPTPWSEASEPGQQDTRTTKYTPSEPMNAISSVLTYQPTSRRPVYDSSSSPEVDNGEGSRKRRRVDSLSGQTDVNSSHTERHTNNPSNAQGSNARENSALVKANRACLRCRKHRIRCKPGANALDDCMPCQKLKPETRALAPSCRELMVDISLYRDQQAPCQLHTQRWHTMNLKDIESWASDDIITVRIAHVKMHKGYELKVRKFVPVQGDMLHERWIVNGAERTHDIPPYAIANMQEATETLKKFIGKSIEDYVEAFIDKEDILISSTYEMALGHFRSTSNDEEKNLLRNTLYLWVCCRKISNPERFCGLDLPGLEITNDPDSPWYNSAPVPPVMVAQMQCILYSQILQPLRKKVLDRLWRMCKRNQRENWYTIYLTMFIILHSCSMFTRRNEEFARSIGLTQRFVNPSAIKKLHSGSETLLKHFHYVNKGSLPFQQVFEEDGLQELRGVGLDKTQIRFITNTARWVREGESMMRETRRNTEYGHDLYWISQLYMPNWFRERPKSLE